MPGGVVIVDDEPDIRFLVRQTLTRAGWEVVGEAGSGREGTEVAERLQPEVILLDLLMDTPGEEALPHLLRVSPSSMVVVFSALQAEDNRDRLLRLGAWAYYEKRELDVLAEKLATDLERFQEALGGEDDVPRWMRRGDT